MMPAVFLHGLDSSSRGTKGRWFKTHFPKMLLADFDGTLSERLDKFEKVVEGCNDLTLIGSSFGGLMATIFSLEQPQRVKRLILLAPALNFPEFSAYPVATTPVPTLLYIGSHDMVCPPDEVLPIACQRFSDLCIRQTDDDHLLHKTFTAIEWAALLGDDLSGTCCR